MNIFKKNCQLLFVIALCTLLFLTASTTLYNRQVSASEITAESQQTGGTRFFSKDILMERALRIASSYGEINAKSIAEMDASQAVYTNAREWRIFNGDAAESERHTLTDPYFDRPVFVVRVDGSDFRARGMPAPPGSKAAQTVYDTIILVLFADTGDIHEYAWIPNDHPVPDLSQLNGIPESPANPNNLVPVPASPDSDLRKSS